MEDLSIFGSKIKHGLNRAGIWTMGHLILEWPNIPKNFNSPIFRHLGKKSYEFIEYFLCVELPLR